MAAQLSLFPEYTAVFPSTRYQGSKAKLVDWIWPQIAGLEFHTCLDAFGGTGAVAYRLKQEGKCVAYNDVLRFNHIIGKAFIENNATRLNGSDIADILELNAEVEYPQFIQQTFHDIYFTGEENAWLDRVAYNLQQLTDSYQYALAFFALCQACIIKRPYNLFHRKNLYLRLAEVERSFGNKASWDRPFEEWFRAFVTEANQAVFDNGQPNRAMNEDALKISGDYDLVYVDPPYISQRGVAIDYRDFYHFLEGLTMYDQWAAQIDYGSKHRRLKRLSDIWGDKNCNHEAFDSLFARFRKSIIVVSYRSDGIPSLSALVELLGRYKEQVVVRNYGEYQYALSTNRTSREVLLIGT